MPAVTLRAFAMACCIALAAPASLAANFLGVEVPAPLPAKNVVDTYWGTPVDDPYRFLEDTKDPAVQAWMKAQADATDAIIAKLPVRDALRKRIAEIDDAVPSVVTSVRRMPSGRYFFLRRNAGENQFKLVRRDKLDGEDVVLVDPDALAKATGKPHAIGEIAPSPDGKLVAYSISTGGTEIGKMHVIDAVTAKEVEPAIDAIRGGGSVAWLEDGSGFFYTRLRPDWASVPATERFLDNLRYLRKLGAKGEDPAVFGPGVHPDVVVPRTAYGTVFPGAGHGAGRCGGDRRRQARAHPLPDGSRERACRQAEMAPHLRRGREDHLVRHRRRLDLCEDGSGSTALPRAAHAARDARSGEGGSGRSGGR